MIDQVDRRIVLRGLAAAPLIALPTVAGSLPSPAFDGASDMNMMTKISAPSHPQTALMASHREAANNRFWDLHSAWRAAKVAWEADDDPDELRWEEWAAKESTAMTAMLMQPVFSTRALMAKYIAVDDPRTLRLPDPVGTADQMFRWDLGRISMLELEAWSPEA